MSVSRGIEIERKYAVPEGVGLPVLADLDAVAAVEAQPLAHLDAVYVDTAERTLLAARIAVRRRTGGHDAGWHVKLPASGGRAELHAPIDADDPDALPDALGRVLVTRLRGRALEPIALIRTERHGVVVSDGAGGRVEVVDDHVTATDVRAGRRRAWREWEAEQVGEPDPSAVLLDVLHDALCATGAAPSASPAKLAQALGLVGVDDTSGPPTTAGGALAAAVAEQAEALHRGVQSLVLDGDRDGETAEALLAALHRIRSALGTAPVAGTAGEALLGRLDALEAPLLPAPREDAALVDALCSPAALDALAALEAYEPDGPLADRPAAAG